MAKLSMATPLNQIVSNVHFLYPMKTAETQRKG